MEEGQSLQMQLFRYQDQEDASRSLLKDPGLSLVAFGHAQEMECLQRHLDIVDQSGSKIRSGGNQVLPGCGVFNRIDQLSVRISAI